MVVTDVLHVLEHVNSHWYLVHSSVEEVVAVQQNKWLIELRIDVSLLVNVHPLHVSIILVLFIEDSLFM